MRAGLSCQTSLSSVFGKEKIGFVAQLEPDEA